MEPARCPHCKVDIAIENVAEHTTFHETVNKLHICQKCDAQLPTAIDLAQHVALHLEAEEQETKRSPSGKFKTHEPDSLNRRRIGYSAQALKYLDRALFQKHITEEQHRKIRAKVKRGTADLYDLIPQGKQKKRSKKESKTQYNQAILVLGSNSLSMGKPIETLTTEPLLKMEYYRMVQHPLEFRLTDAGDRNWGCGYRNAQVLMDYARKRYPDYYRRCLLADRVQVEGKEDLNPDAVPSVVMIQRLIEWAWQCGFDKEGAEQLGWRLQNTSTWIGPTEVWAMMTCLGFRVQLLDVPYCPSSFSPDMDEILSPRFLFSGLHNTFEDPRPFFRVIMDPNDVSPVFLQWNGHSVTVLGLRWTLPHERDNGNLELIVNDPKLTWDRVQQGLASPENLPWLTIADHELREPEYSMLEILGPREDHDLDPERWPKFPTSIRIEVEES
eukprot:Clim_evm53s251 gene=Clim_evmTU53s251